jgi:hypothetical protein
VAPVLADLRRARRLEVEVRGSARRPGGRERITRRTSACRYSGIRSRKASSSRGAAARTSAEIAAATRARAARSDSTARRRPAAPPQLGEVVRRRLDAHQEAVERGDVDAGRVEPGLERLHERRPGAGERIEDVAAGGT